MSPRVSGHLRDQVLVAAGGLCAYCRSAETLMGVTFEVDHIVPESAGGPTNLDNLCLSCPSCNRFKASRLIAQDPENGAAVSLFHPTRQAWDQHFAWSDDGRKIVGLTSAGRATIEALQMNRKVIVQLRGYWVALGLHPPR
jgi:hypothetical protein